MTVPGRPAVVIAATLDTKSTEVAFVRREFERRGMAVTVIDCGILGEPGTEATFTRAAVARAGGGDIAAMRASRDRASAIPTMIRGLEAILLDLQGKAQIAGYFGLGGGTNAALASAAFALLPFGQPKMLVSTVACGNTRPFIGMKDVVLVHSVVDVLGLNAFLEDVLARAVSAFCAMLDSPAEKPERASRVCIGMTTFGSTTEGATIAHDTLVGTYDILSFHARGIGGEAMEAFVREGRVHAVLDLTTTEVADELVGGICSAGPNRLSAASEMGVPQVVLPGAIDMVNFGPPATVPERFKHRTFTSHTPHATLMRTTADENVAIAEFIAAKLNRAKGPAAVVLPLRGFSAYDIAGGPFFDPDADAAFCAALTARLDPAIPVERVDAHINERVVIDRATRLLTNMISRSNRVEAP
ncbi:Tm-1-like ATP-binding domain-containing protein [Bradyrhizobium erythrophlei]|uniref:Tm-1-like ATP-binding domain-containing protein n=1 Tax=Bradyrhizobium erythrophlei TaxID=1437360 RepID=UPI0035EF3EF4